MKRWYFAITVLLGGSLAVAEADYVRLVYTLSVTPGKKGPNPTTTRPMMSGTRPTRPGIGIGPSFGGGAAANAAKFLNSGVNLDLEALQAEVVVEVKGVEAPILTDPNTGRPAGIFQRIKHKWGKSCLTTNKTIHWVNVPLPTTLGRYKKKYLEDTNGGKSKTPEKLLDLADYALAHALLDEISSATKPKSEVSKQGLIEDLKQLALGHPVVAAFDRLQAEMSRPITKEDESASWKERLIGDYKIRKSPHFALIHNSFGEDSPEAQSRLDALEMNYKAFYYWFALNGQLNALRIPDRRLIAFLVDNPTDFYTMHKAFDSPELLVDGFYSPSDNLVVFSNQRLDSAYEALSKSTTDLNAEKDDILKSRGQRGVPVNTRVQNEVAVLMRKAMEEEAELAGASLEGTRQLMTASGMVPRGLAAPGWIQAGLPAFFETPKGAYWPGWGAPSWTYLARFKLMEEEKELEDAEVALRNVVSDQYFRIADASERKGASTRARTMAWALTYFLMKSIDRDTNQPRLIAFMRYLQELAKLPRNLEFDSDLLWSTFIRTVNLADAADPNKIDENKLRMFAREWYDFIHYQPLEIETAVTDLKRSLERQGKKPAAATGKPTPSVPGVPGQPPKKK